MAGTALEWTKVKANAADPEKFEATYAEWEQMAEQTLASLRSRGLSVKKCFVSAEELPARGASGAGA
ncbi:hypothetical protein C7T35_17985 [Variovorax sp. WS11]|nr:hypothetical protein C7T35_17985 [Variovorax sp. WS11]